MKHAAWSVLARSVLSAVVLLLAARDATQAQGAPPAADTTGIAARCRAPEHRQFDFWLGAWDVRNSDGQLLGHNEIQRVAGGCALLENWRGAGGGRGTSVNTYDADLGKWTQRWVGSGATLWLEGSFADSTMVLTGTALRTTSGGKVLDRLAWTLLADGRVRQAWDISVDGGKSWTSSFVGFYSRAGERGGGESPARVRSPLEASHPSLE